jgi:hypothetical protein
MGHTFHHWVGADRAGVGVKVFSGASSSSTSSTVGRRDFFAAVDRSEIGDCDRFRFCDFFRVCRLPFALVFGIVFEGRAAASWK